MAPQVKKSWEEVYNKNIPKMVGICYRYVCDKQLAEDLAHNAIVTAMEKESTYSGKGVFEAWLRQITVNTALQHLRKQQRIDKENEQFAYKNRYNTDSSSFDMEESKELNDFSRQELLDAINCLPEHHRLVFNMYVLDNYSHKQIAEELEITVGTSKSHLARARQKLQQILKLKEEKKKRFFVLLFPFGKKGLDKIYHQNLYDYGVQPQVSMSFASLSCSELTFPKVTYFPKGIIVKYILATFIVGSVIGLIFIDTNVSETPDSSILDKAIVDTVQMKRDTLPLRNNAPDTVIIKPVIIKKTVIRRKQVVVKNTIKIHNK